MKFFIPLLLALLTACYSKPEIEGFDEDEWKTEIKNCKQSKVAQARLLIENKAQLLGKGQSKIKSFLGKPHANELYQRNQKFFYYRLTPPDSCANVDKELMLSIRFDAIDRVKELMIIE